MDINKENLSLHLPNEYSKRNENAFYLDDIGEFKYQPHVYELAVELALKSNASHIVDIGSGSGQKLEKIQEKFNLFCIDTNSSLEITRNTLPNATFVEADLNNGLFGVDKSIFRNAVVICADVIEHLQTPAILVQDLAELQKIASFILISTPDRIRARGPLDNGPPANSAHVLEWSLDEFARFLRSCGFPSKFFVGHTINTDYHFAKVTSLAILGKESEYPTYKEPTSVAAIINTYNEIDIIEEVVHHLNSQGVEVHIFDNWSTDGTWESLCNLQNKGSIANISRFPERPTDSYEWFEQLRNVEIYSQSLSADWIMHYDADELRYSPWSGVTLSEAFQHVGRMGYNAVDFTILNFRFVDSQKRISGSCEKSLPYFQFGTMPGHFLQIKAFRKMDGNANISQSGGHEAIFDGRRVYPIKFLTKHYPLRSQEQAEKKLFVDRIPRYEKENAERGWHTHYKSFARAQKIPGWKRSELIPWHPELFETEYLVERLCGLGVEILGDVGEE